MSHWITFCAYVLLGSLGAAVAESDSEPLFKNLGEEIPTSEAKPWALRGLVGYGTTSALFEALRGDYQRVPGTFVYSLELSYLLKENWNDWPIDVSLAGAMMFHRSDEDPKNVFQKNVYVKFEWTEFWWNDYLRTRFGVAEGLSYVDRVTFSESERRDGNKSKNFLNYLDFSLSLNMADLGNLMKIDKVIDYKKSTFENSWLVFNVSHRSGAFGTFGRYSDGIDGSGKRRPIKGGDNIVMIGLTHRF